MNRKYSNICCYIIPVLVITAIFTACKTQIYTHYSDKDDKTEYITYYDETITSTVSFEYRVLKGARDIRDIAVKEAKINLLRHLSEFIKEASKDYFFSFDLEDENNDSLRQELAFEIRQEIYLNVIDNATIIEENIRYHDKYSTVTATIEVEKYDIIRATDKVYSESKAL